MTIMSSKIWDQYKYLSYINTELMYIPVFNVSNGFFIDSNSVELMNELF